MAEVIDGKRVAADVVARAAGLSADQMSRVWADIGAKRRATRYLHLAPQFVEPVDEVARWE